MKTGKPILSQATSLAQPLAEVSAIPNAINYIAAIRTLPPGYLARMVRGATMK